MNEPGQLVHRDLLAKYFGKDPRLVSAFEDQARAVVRNADDILAATGSMNDASVVTLSANASFKNEFILTSGDGTRIEAVPGGVTINVNETVARTSGGQVTFDTPGIVALGLPASGTLVSDTATAILYNKTLDKTTKFQNLVNCDTDAEAAAAGVPLWGIYRDGNVVCIRVV